jgi:hypothetical protein
MCPSENSVEVDSFAWAYLFCSFEIASQLLHKLLCSVFSELNKKGLQNSTFVLCFTLIHFPYLWVILP